MTFSSGLEWLEALAAAQQATQESSGERGPSILHAKQRQLFISCSLSILSTHDIAVGRVKSELQLTAEGVYHNMEFAALASLVTAQPGQLGAYLTIAAEATSTSRKSRKRISKPRGEVLPEFIFMRGPLSLVPFGWTSSLRSRFSKESTSAVPAELQSAVSNAIGIGVREMVDRCLSAAFKGKHPSSQRRMSPEVPVFFIEIEDILFVRDTSAGQFRVISVELGRSKQNPMDNLGTPWLFTRKDCHGRCFSSVCLGHVKSAGLTDIIRQTILDARSVGPLHQPALAGHMGALREEVGWLHQWLVGLGPDTEFMQQIIAERLMENLQQQLETQKLQHQQLLQHIAAQQEQHRIIQRQQQELLGLHQQQQRPPVEQSQPTPTEEAKD
ncbi:hypothetical protein Esti_005125 [Eimeria stiedai]